MGLIADLGRGTVAIDTSILIYFIEDTPRFLPLVSPLFEEADRGQRELVTSAVTLFEVLVVPSAGWRRSAGRTLRTLTDQESGRSNGRHQPDQLRAAAQLRAVTGVKSPDALKLVCAVGTGCKTFLTNDRELPSLPGLRVIQLSSYFES